MTDLATRIETEPPSRELDGLIALGLGWKHHFGDGYCPDWDEVGGHWLPPEIDAPQFECLCEHDTHFTEPPHYTSSETDAFAMLEEGGWSGEIYLGRRSVQVELHRIVAERRLRYSATAVSGPHKIARAITAARIRAKEGER